MSTLTFRPSNDTSRGSLAWLQRMHPDVRNLQPCYAERKSRMVTYRQRVDLMMTEVRVGKKVCAVFYGHPGIFAWSPHEAIEVARAGGCSRTWSRAFPPKTATIPMGTPWAMPC